MPTTQAALRAALSALCVLLMGGCGQSESADGKASIPIILVSLDTCRADRLGIFGAVNPNSPALDRLAAESVVFTDCLAQSSNTGPSHRSLFTGTYPLRHRHQAGVHIRSPFTLAGELQKAGWETVAFTGGGFMSGTFGFADGFDLYVDHDEAAPEQYRRGLQTILPQVELWRAARRESDPFFLFLHTYDIHCPYWARKPWRERYGSWYEGDLKVGNLCGREDFDAFMRTQPRREDLEYLNAMYDAGVAMTDDLLGRWLNLLRGQGVLDKAMLIILSDHGESLGDHGYIGHNRMWEEQLQVPLLVRFPGGKYGGTVVDEPVMLVDILPTLLDQLELEMPRGIQGESLLPLIRGEKSFGGQRFRFSQYQEWLSVRWDRQWKAVIRQTGDGKASARLYNLLADPKEEHNLLDPMRPDSADHRAQLDAMLAQLRTWRESERDLDEALAPEILQQEVDPRVQSELNQLGYVGDEDDG